MKTEVREQIANRLAELMEQITTPETLSLWMSSFSIQRNPVSKTVYQGFNALFTSVASQVLFAGNPNWLTFLQAKQLGGNVRKGEKATLITYFSPTESSKISEEESDDLSSCYIWKLMIISTP